LAKTPFKSILYWRRLPLILFYIGEDSLLIYLILGKTPYKSNLHWRRLPLILFYIGEYSLQIYFILLDYRPPNPLLGRVDQPDDETSMKSDDWWDFWIFSSNQYWLYRNFIIFLSKGQSTIIQYWPHIEELFAKIERGNRLNPKKGFRF